MGLAPTPPPHPPKPAANSKQMLALNKSWIKAQIPTLVLKSGIKKLFCSAHGGWFNTEICLTAAD